MDTPRLRDLFVLAARKLRAEFDESSVDPHPAQRGAEREELLTDFLTTRLPRRFSVAKGRVIDARDCCTPQLDIVVYDALSAVVYRPVSGGAYLPFDCVAATIEVKSTLDRVGVREAFERAALVKSLDRRIWQPEGSPIDRFVPYTFLFAYRSKLSGPELAEAYSEEFFGVQPGTHLDFIFVLDDCQVSLWVSSPREGAARKYEAHLRLGKPHAEGKSLLMLARPGSRDVLGAIPFDVRPGTVITVEALQTGEITLQAFMRILTVLLETTPTFPGAVPWNIDETFQYSSRTLGVAIDAKTEPTRYQEEINAVFDRFAGGDRSDSDQGSRSHKRANSRLQRTALGAAAEPER